MADKEKISVLIPTKNEPLINELIRELHTQLANYTHEIIVIDKSDVALKIDDKQTKLVIQQSDGLGRAVQEGLVHATGSIIVIMDADFSHDPADVPKLVEAIATKKFDVAIGSRFASGGITKDETGRKIVSAAARKFTAAVLGLKIKDTMSGFSATRKQVFDKIKLNPLGYKINLEILYKAGKQGFVAGEVPITFRKRREGKSKVGYNVAGLKEIVRIIVLTFRLRLNLS
jgi:dolichol-phosphate mannosyltransferase